MTQQCLGYAASLDDPVWKDVVTEWPDEVSDTIIKDCRVNGWLDTWETSGVAIASVDGQRGYGGGRPRDRITDEGRAVLARIQAAVTDLLLCRKCGGATEHDQTSYWCDRCQQLWPLTYR